jgi:tetratricopeptide (TPR) repeat protein
LTQAWESCSTALQIARQLAEKDPNNQEWQANVAEVSERAGDILKAQANFPEAIKMYLSAMSIRANLSARDAKWQMDAAKNEEETADALLSEGEYERALAFSHSAVKRGELLSNQSQTDTDVLGNLATGYLELGEALLRQKRPDEALSNLRKSSQIFDQLENQYPNHADWESGAAFTRLLIADVLRVNASVSQDEIRNNLMQARDILESRKQRFSLGIVDQAHLREIEDLLRDLAQQ